MNQLPFREQLEKHNNPEEVRQRLAAGNYNQRHAKIAKEYLASIDRKQTEIVAVRKENREEETLAIAKDALTIAKEANRVATENLAAAQSSAENASILSRWAIWTAVIAVVASIISVASMYYQGAP